MGIKVKILAITAAFIFLFPSIVFGADTTLTLKVTEGIYDKFGPLKVVLTGSYLAGPVDWTDTTPTKDGDYRTYKVSATDAWNSKAGLELWVQSEDLEAHDGTAFYWNVTGINLANSMTVVLKPDPAHPSDKAIFRNTTAAPDVSLHIETTNVDSLTSPSVNPGNCSDGIKNGNEDDVDLGGRCGTCSDDIKNGDETGKDSGGRCATGGGNGEEAEKAEPIGVTIKGGTLDTLPVPSKGCATGVSAKYTSGILEGVYCNKPITTLPQVMSIIKNVMNKILLPSAGTIFTIMIIVGGIVYITSNGNEQRATKAKGILTAAIVGLLITVLAFAIVYFFAAALGGGIA